MFCAGKDSQRPAPSCQEMGATAPGRSNIFRRNGGWELYDHLSQIAGVCVCVCVFVTHHLQKPVGLLEYFFDGLQEANNRLSISLEACQTKLRRRQTPLELKQLVKRDVEAFLKAQPQSVNRDLCMRRLLTKWHTGTYLMCRAMPGHWAVSVSTCHKCDTRCLAYKCLIHAMNKSGSAVQHRVAGLSATSMVHATSLNCSQGDPIGASMCTLTYFKVFSCILQTRTTSSWRRSANS